MTFGGTKKLIKANLMHFLCFFIIKQTQKIVCFKNIKTINSVREHSTLALRALS